MDTPTSVDKELTKAIDLVKLSKSLHEDLCNIADEITIIPIEVLTTAEQNIAQIILKNNINNYENNNNKI